MKKSLTYFLQSVAVLIGIIVLALMLWEPWLEGVNANATFFQVYFDDLFLAYAYASSIAFFASLYQVFKLIGYVGQGKTYTPDSVKALRIIKYCMATLTALIAAPVAYLFIVRPGDDIAGGVAVGLFLILVSAVTAIVATMFQKRLQSGINI